MSEGGEKQRRPCGGYASLNTAFARVGLVGSRLQA